MRLPALLFVTVLALLPAAARAQVTVQDQADTFMDDRTRHQARMDQNPEKWWNGDVYDRASSTTLYDPHEYSESPMLLNVPGGTNQPTQAAATPIPGNPETVQPHFTFDEMNDARRESEPSEAPIDFSNPTDIENAIRRGIGAARGLAGGASNTGDITEIPTAPGGQDLPQPVPAQEAAPLRDRAVTLPAAAPYVPSDPKPAAIKPPPVQDEAGATAINPNAAPAAASPDAPPAETTTTAIPALEEAAATPADSPAAENAAAETPAASNRRAFGTAVAPGRDEEAAPGLTP